jgi:hypothetical protein
MLKVCRWNSESISRNEVSCNLVARCSYGSWRVIFVHILLLLLIIIIIIIFYLSAKYKSMMYRRERDFLGDCIVFNYFVLILHGGFLHEIRVCLVSFYGTVSDGGKVIVYVVLCPVWVPRLLAII